MAGALEILRESGADEACGAGDEDFHGVLFGGLIMAQKLEKGDARFVIWKGKRSGFCLHSSDMTCEELWRFRFLAHPRRMGTE